MRSARQNRNEAQAMKRHLSFVAALGMCFFTSFNAAHAQVRADSGSIAIGGSVTGSTVIIGIPQEKVDELVRDAKRPLEDLSTQQRDNIALLKEKLDLNERQVRAALGILGENDIPPERLAAKLVEIAERFKDLQATASAQPGDDPKIAALKTKAQKAIEAGQLAEADALLADVETEQRRSLDRLAVNAAETSARRGEIALTRLRYGEAAKHFANAAALFPPGGAHEDKRVDYLTKEAKTLGNQGDEFGDNDALRAAIERYKRLSELNRHERGSVVWAAVQNSLGGALWMLGQRESETTRLEEAAAVYRDVLQATSHEQIEWARAQRGLGNTLLALGWREFATTKLEEAVAAYRNALQVGTRERVPLEWAIVQHNLALALATMGERDGTTTKLEEAVAAYRELLKEWTRQRAPLDWAMTQNNLGTILHSLGRGERGTTRLDEPITAYREALEERTRERVPLQWAATQTNLGVVLQTLAEREGGMTKLEEAIAAYREALKEQTRERVPLEWASTQNNLGTALSDLSKRQGDTSKLEEAVAAYREALQARTRERVPLEWAATKSNLGNALSDLGQLDEAVAAYREALEERTRERVPFQWAALQRKLGSVLLDLGLRESATTRLEEALAAYREALKEDSRRGPSLWASTLGYEGFALMVLAERRVDPAIAESALDRINTAVEMLRDSGDPTAAIYEQMLLSPARSLVARLRAARQTEERLRR
jgi:tetratricopeptide (TPR) repeat protein